MSTTKILLCFLLFYTILPKSADCIDRALEMVYDSLITEKELRKWRSHICYEVQ